jgi:hypothetical protein
LATNALAARRLVAMSDPPGDPREDAAWSLEARSRREFVRVIVVSPQDAATAPLLRSTCFNPRDVYLPRSKRLAVAEAIAAIAPQVAKAVADYEAAADREFELARSRGQAVAIDLARFRGNLQLRPLGQDPYFRVVENVTWGVAQKDMPGTFVARGHLRRTGAALVDCLSTAFLDAGALTTEEADALRTKAHQIAGDESVLR